MGFGESPTAIPSGFVVLRQWLEQRGLGGGGDTERAVATAHLVPSCSSQSPRQRATLNVSLRACSPSYPVLGLPRDESTGAKNNELPFEHPRAIHTLLLLGREVRGVVVTWLKNERKAMQAPGAQALPFTPSQASGPIPTKETQQQERSRPLHQVPLSQGQPAKRHSEFNF